MDDWTFEETIGAPATIKIEFMDPSGAAQTAELISTTWSKTYTTYITWEYTDRDDKPQTQDVAKTRVSDTRSTVAAVNGSLVKWKLQQGEGLPAGDAMRQSTTVYEYANSKDGPKLIRETTDEFISEYELAGSLNINDYTGFTPGPAMVQASRTINEYNEISGPNIRTATKTTTSRYAALGLTQEGQQSTSKQLQEDPGTGVVTTKVFNAAKALVFDGTEVRNSIGRAPLPARPSGYELLANELLNPTDSEAEDGSTDSGSTTTDETDSSGSVTVRFDFTGLGLGSELDYAYYSLPFTPDLYQGRTGRYAAELAAREYARCLNGLKAAYAFGFNITTSADRLPSLPLSPLFINAAGLSVAMRCNGVSWAFDASGLVASADMMLCGVAGRIGPVSSSWVRLPVPTASLPVLSEPTVTEDPAPASTITAPSGFDATSPGSVFSLLPTTNTDAPALTQTTTAVVEPYLLIEPLVARSRHRMRIAEFEYPLLSTEAIDLISHHRATAGVAIGVVAPAVEVAAAALAPSVSTGAAIAVPVVAVAAVAEVPVIAAGKALAVPAVDVAVAALEPQVPREALLVPVPGVEVAAATGLPNVAAGKALIVPAVDVSVTAAAPTVDLFDPLDLAPLRWWDVSDGATVTTSSGAITQVDDKSGNGASLEQATSAERPTLSAAAINGLDAADWGSSANGKSLLASANVTLREVWVICKLEATGSTFPDFVGLVNPGNDFSSLLLTGGSGGTGFSGSGFSVYLNGGTTNTASDVFDEIKSLCLVRAVFDSDRTTTGGVRVGLDRNYSNLNRGWRGLIGEVLVFGSALSAGDAAKLAGYLKGRWGIS